MQPHCQTGCSWQAQEFFILTWWFLWLKRFDRRLCNDSPCTVCDDSPCTVSIASTYPVYLRKQIQGIGANCMWEMIHVSVSLNPIAVMVPSGSCTDPAGLQRGLLKIREISILSSSVLFFISVLLYGSVSRLVTLTQTLLLFLQTKWKWQLNPISRL